MDRANKKKNHAGRACQGDTRSLSVLWVNRMAISVKSQIETMSNKRYEIGDTLVVFFASIQNWIIRLYKFLGARTFLFLFDRAIQAIGNSKIIQDPNLVIPER